jgi:hypothetical protein
MSNNLQLKRGLQSALPIGLSGELLFTTDTKRLYLSDGSANNLLQGSDSIFTTGSIPFSNSSGKLTTDSSNFYWDDTNNRLGIGTASPTVPFDLRGNQLITFADVANRDAGPFAFNVTNGTFSKFNLVYEATATRVNIFGTSTQGLRIDCGSNNQITALGSSGLSINATGNNLTINGGTNIFSTVSVERMRLNTTGNLLINTTTDNGGKLQIKAPGALSTDIALRVRNSADTFDIIKANGAGDVYIGVAAGRVSTGTNNSFFGAVAGYSNTTGNDNTFVGNSVGANNNTGIANTFLGSYTAYQNTTGNNNTAIGFQAARFISNGVTAASIISNSVFVGRNAYPLANNQTNQIVIGDSAIGIGSNSVVLGNDSIVTTALKGNVGIGTTAPVVSAKVQVDSTTQGFLPPRMTTTQKNAIATPASGLIVYDTTLGKLCVRGAAAWETITSI